MENTAKSKVLPWVGLLVTLIFGLLMLFIAIVIFPDIKFTGKVLVFVISILGIDPMVRYRFGPF